MKLAHAKNTCKVEMTFSILCFTFRMAQQGFVVSVSTPWKREDGNVENLYRMCRERNEILARKDPGIFGSNILLI